MLFMMAVVIVSVSLWYTNKLVNKIAQEERKKVQLWADAIQRKAVLVKYTEELFGKIKVQERKRVEIWAEANKRLFNAGFTEDLTFYLEIIQENTTIPVVVVNKMKQITNAINIDFNKDSVKVFDGRVKDEFSVHKPIAVSYPGNTDSLYYKDSKIFTELRDVLNNIIQSFISEVVINSASVPVIITDSTKGKVLAFGNIDSLKIRDEKFLKRTISLMSMQNKPIEIELPEHGKNYIFYKDSFLLTQLRYYPYVQFFIIGLFLLVAYMLFSTSRKAEQNQVWMGMAKETAHQLGTPLSSLMAWVEVLKSKNVDEGTISEVRKDVKRLETITERFSKIGSPPRLENMNITEVIYKSVQYLKSRTSKSVNYIINIPEGKEIYVPVNSYLFEWVIENICKNAIDAMEGTGKIEIDVEQVKDLVNIDISDTGKGIQKSNFKTIFDPGYTTKKGGWGLGLSLAERIIEIYHSGRLFVKSSVINKGTTFRIVLKSNVKGKN